MAVEITVHAKATPDSLETQSSRKFDLSFSVDVTGHESLADLSDAEIYDLVYPKALQRVMDAMQSIADGTRSRLLRTIPHEETSYEFTGNPTTSSENGAMKQHHEIDGQMIVDTEVPASVGESWLIGQSEAAKGVAENIVSNVLRGLGRQSVEIENHACSRGGTRDISTMR